MPPRKSPAAKRKAPAVSTRQQKAKLAEAANDESDGFVWSEAWPKAESNVVNTTEHDKPHQQTTEYWTIQAQFQDAAGLKYSVFATFAKLATAVDADGFLVHWSLIDEASQRVWTTPVADSAAVRFLVRSIKSGNYPMDPRLAEAFLEVYKDSEKLPLPDRWCKQAAECSADGLRLALGDNSLAKSAKGEYVMKCANSEAKVAFELTLNPGKTAAVRLGANGLVQQNLSKMFSYVVPGCKLAGTLAIEGAERAVHGSADFVRKFAAPLPVGGVAAEDRDEAKQGEDEEDAEKSAGSTAGSPFGRDYMWRQVCLGLSDGTKIYVTVAQDPVEGETVSQSSVIVLPDGQVKTSELVQFVPAAVKASSASLRAQDTSARTTQYFPSQWTLIADGGRYNLSVGMLFQDQEFCSWFANPSFWHGRVTVAGLVGGQDVAGDGFLEIHPNRPIDSLSAFFGRINDLVLAELERLLPRNPTYEQVRDLMTTPKYEHFMNGANIEVFRDTIIKPLRDYIDRGFGDEGASWRTFCMLMCMDAVGGDCNRFRNWLSMPELMHVGALVVDDIEDEAESRRGGASSHKQYGTAIAINAGTAAYFVSMFVLQKGTPNLSDRARIKLYEYYMVKMRCGHVGQAFDIEGLDKFVPPVLESGNTAELEQRILTIHRLKMAVPSGCLARMGGLVGGGSPDQQHAIGMYVEQIGIASEVIQSIRSIQGCVAGRKPGHQIRNGNIPLPLAKALGMLDKAEERQALWDLVLKAREEKGGDAAIRKLLAQLQSIGALEAVQRQVQQMVDDAWVKVNELVPDSFSKLMLRSFASFVLSQSQLQQQ